MPSFFASESTMVDAKRSRTLRDSKNLMMSLRRLSYGSSCLRSFSSMMCHPKGECTGLLTSPTFNVDGEATLVFRAAGWYKDDMSLKVNIATDYAELADTTLTMASFAWTDFTVHFEGKGHAHITFRPNRRFILDDVLVVRGRQEQPALEGDLNADGIVDLADVATAISLIAAAPEAERPDLNADGQFDIADILCLLNKLRPNTGGE